MRKIEKVINRLIEKTDDHELHWERPTSGCFEAEIKGKNVRIYQNGTISVDNDEGNWKQRTESGVELYKAARAEARPEWVDSFINKVLNS